MNQKFSTISFRSGAFACAALLIAVGLPDAQDMDVQGDGSNGNIILQGKNINPQSSDKIGVQGVSTPAGNYGIGVKGLGGYRGVEGRVDASVPNNSGIGDRAGLYGAAYNGATNYGVKAYAVSGVGLNYAVWGSATGTNSRAGYFSGNVEYTGALTGPSDNKLKRNMKAISNCSGLISRLTPTEFEYRSDEFPTMNLPRSKQKGLIAQEVEAVLPDLVQESTIPNPEETDSKTNPFATAKVETYKSVNYVGLIPVLIGAIKEQQIEIANLKASLAALKK